MNGDDRRLYFLRFFFCFGSRSLGKGFRIQRMLVLVMFNAHTPIQP